MFRAQIPFDLIPKEPQVFHVPLLIADRPGFSWRDGGLEVASVIDRDGWPPSDDDPLFVRRRLFRAMDISYSAAQGLAGSTKANYEAIVRPR